MIRQLPAVWLVLSVSAGAAHAESVLECSGEARSDRSPLHLALSPDVASAPARVTAHVRVEPDAHWDTLTIEWRQSDGRGGSHHVTLDGDRSTERQDYVIKRMEPGDYVISATLVRDDHSVLRREAKVSVTAP